MEQSAAPAPYADRSAESYPFRGGYPYLRYPKVPVMHAVLTVPDPQVRYSNERPRMTVDIRLFHDSGRDEFYNVHWDPLIPLPGHLGLYGADNHDVMDLVKRGPGSRRMAGPRDWTVVWSRGYVGAVFSVSLPRSATARLSPGTYCVQVIYTQNAVLRPGDPAKPMGPTDNDPETFRSNAVKITVVE